MISRRVDNAISVAERPGGTPELGIVRDLPVQLPLLENAGLLDTGHQTIGRLVMRSTASLRPHSEIVKLDLSPTDERILALEKHGNSIFEQPLVITQDDVIIDGHARWRIASHQKRETLLCFEIQNSQQEALQRVLETHSRTDWLHPFSRVELTRTLNPPFRDLARANQSAGGVHKASSNLTKDHRVDCRAKMAAIAKVSTGTWTHAEQIIDSGCSQELIQALRRNEVSINYAWKLRNSSACDQQDALVKRRREKRGRSSLAHLRVLSKRVSHEVPGACLNDLKLTIKWMKDLDLPSEIGKKMDGLLVAIELEEREQFERSA